MENEELLQLNKKINALSDDLEELKYVISKKIGSNTIAISGALGQLSIASIGHIKDGKTSFADSTNAGYFISKDGIYVGAEADASKLKYIIATGVFDFLGTIAGGSTIDGKAATGFSTVVNDGVAPAAPSGLTASAGVQGVFLKWNWNAETDMDHYDVYRYTTDTQASAVKIASVKVNMLWDSGLTAAQAYYYWLKAVDRIGNVSGFNASAGTTATPRNVGETDVSDDAITAAKINVAQLNAISADLGAITAGSITMPNTGYIKGGQTAFHTGTGFFLGYSTNDYKFSIGNPEGNYLKWDGSFLEIVGKTAVRSFSASANSRNTNAPERQTSSATYVKVKECLLNEDLGACRIKFTLRRLGTGGAGAQARIYKNGVAIGTERSIGDLAEFSEDFTGFVAGDLIQIYAKTNDTWAGVYAMSFSYDYNITKIGVETLTTPLEVTEIAISITNQDPA